MSDSPGEPAVGFALELTPEQPPSEVASLARSAETAGFQTVFVSHHYNNRDEFLTLAEIADSTATIQLGPGITNPYETHPVTLASRMATLDELADGRGVFGVGPGDESTLANLGIERERPLGRVLETVKLTRRLWNGERVDHDGTFEAVDAGLNYEADSIPVYVGAQGPDMTRMAAKYADGVLYNGAHPRDISWASQRVQEGLSDRPHRASDRGVSAGAFDFAVYASVSVADDPERARETARRPVAFITASAPTPVLKRHEIDQETAGAIGQKIAAGEFTAAFDQVTPAMIDAFCLAGTPADVDERIETIREKADSIVLGSPLGPDIERAIELMGEKRPRSREQ